MPATSAPAVQDTAAPATVPAAAKAAIGDFGLDLSAGNAQVKPGDDFFAYANGAWYENFTIPADKASFGPFDRLDDLSKQRVRGIIEQAAVPTPPPVRPSSRSGTTTPPTWTRRRSRPTGSRRRRATSRASPLRARPRRCAPLR